MLVYNPIYHSWFLPTLTRISILLVAGFFLVIFFYRGKLTNLWQHALGKRYLSWLVLAPLFLIAAFAGPLPGGLLLLVFSTRALFEYKQVTKLQKPYFHSLLIFLVITFLVAGFIPELFFTLTAFVILFTTTIPILSDRIEDLYMQMTLSYRGYLYTIWSLAHAALLKQFSLGLLLVAAIGAALADVFAYTVGKLLGKHIIAPRVNPRKAWEGILGDLLGASIAVSLFGFVLPDSYGLVERYFLILIIGLGSAWGDLISSLVKRVSGVKDWGTDIPGHGGVLDRLNSMIITIPAVYYFAKILELW